MTNSGYDVGGQYMYFKAGAYIQDNTGDAYRLCTSDLLCIRGDTRLNKGVSAIAGKVAGDVGGGFAGGVAGDLTSQAIESSSDIMEGDFSKIDISKSVDSGISVGCSSWYGYQ